MGSINKVILIGNLGRDPEMKYTSGGMAITKFSIATTHKSKGGEEETEWHNIVTFDKLANTCNEYLSKGKQVYLEGRLKTSSWEDRESGQKRYKTEVIAIHVTFLGSKRDGSGGYRQQSNEGYQQNGGGYQQNGGGGGYQQQGYQQQGGGGGYQQPLQQPMHQKPAQQQQQAPIPQQPATPYPQFHDDDDIPF